MKLNYAISFLIFFPVLLIQVTVVPLISVQGVIPDLILILVVFYGIVYGQIYGTVLGFVYGFFFDLITGSLLGSTMIAKTVAGFTAGYFDSETKRDSYLIFYNFGLIVLLCALIDSTVYTMISAIDLSINIFQVFFQNALLPAFYTSLLSMIFIVFIPKRKIF